MSVPIVEVIGVSKRFARDGFEVVALDNINLEIQRGDFLALMGPSGSGKSTLLNLLAGIDRSTEGQVNVLGTDLARLKESELAVWRNSHVGYIFQTFNLIPVLTAFENVELPLLLTRLPKAKRRENVQTALELVGLSDRMHHQPRQLSGGQEQRVAIARAIVADPDLLLADEPTGNLDSATSEEIMRVFEELAAAGQTVIMVTHEQDIAAHARRVIVLRDGMIAADDPKERFTASVGMQS